MDFIPVTVTSHDIHPFKKDSNGPVILAGINIPCDRSLQAHSDGDVVLHAIIDAILGILAVPYKRDIGSIFPDDEKKWKDVNSALFLQETLEMASKKNIKIHHINVQVICKTPKLGEYKESMVQRISALTSLPMNAINVQAASNNGCDSTGNGDSIAVLASVTALKPV